MKTSSSPANKMTPRRRSGWTREREGGSLIEIMFAILILAILTVAMVSGVAYPRALVSTAAHKQAAIHAANDILEEIYSMGYSSAQSAMGNSSMVDHGAHYTMDGQSLSVSRNITAWDAGTPPTLLVAVSVDYPGADAPIELRTLITP